MGVSDTAGIKVDKTRIQSIIISTVLAGFGQIIYLQNIGTLNTYNGADQCGLFAAAALLVGGATVSKATIPNAIIGTGLFHLMFIVMPIAGKNLTNNAMIGEYFRMFVSYGVITIALILHAWKRQKDKEADRAALRMAVVGTGATTTGSRGQ
jgi:simple sugar transport system permease protein